MENKDTENQQEENKVIYAIHPVDVMQILDVIKNRNRNIFSESVLDAQVSFNIDSRNTLYLQNAKEGQLYLVKYKPKPPRLIGSVDDYIPSGGNGCNCSGESAPSAFRINNQWNDYTTLEEDFDGATIIRCCGDTDQAITITMPPSEDFIGKTLSIRKIEFNETSTVTLLAGEGVSLNPADSNVLRRSGSSATLLYIGEGYFDVFCELA